MPIPLSDGVHWVYVGSNGFASVHEGKYTSRSRRASLGQVMDPAAAGEAWLKGTGQQERRRELVDELKERFRGMERALAEAEANAVPAEVMAALRVVLSEKSMQAAYRARAKELHPDQGGDAGEFRELGEARDVITGWLKAGL